MTPEQMKAMGMVPVKCPACGHVGLLPNGTCKICPSCFQTTGCS